LPRRESRVERHPNTAPILIIDNYDSFTYNLVQLVGAMGERVIVKRNDQLAIPEAQELNPSSLIVSPGPGTPVDAGISIEIVRHFADKIPVLGVCLGHQCIAHAFGGIVERAPRVMHGKVSPIYHDGLSIYRGLSNPFIATRYHSLSVKEQGLPDCLEVSAYTSEGEIMGIRVKGKPVEGVQFHPESILARDGKRLMAHFLELRNDRPAVSI
jgi:anthranilate synthase/aminodeoxychorismate synthase-like glutamine amidotransferase